MARELATVVEDAGEEVQNSKSTGGGIAVSARARLRLTPFHTYGGTLFDQ